MIRGWCPSLYEPMPTGDGLLVRVKPYGGALAAEQTAALAAAARRFGNGTIELTTRASLQIRGLTPATLAAFAAAMVEAGLAHPDPEAERRRTVLATGASALVTALETALEQAQDLAPLPAKFGFAIDHHGTLPQADIHVRCSPERIELICGALSTLMENPLPPGEGRVRGEAATPHPNPLPEGEGASAIIETLLTLARFYLALATPDDRRMRHLVARTGPALFAAAGLRAGQAARLRTPPPPIGEQGQGVFGAGLPFGSAPAALWAQLGALHLTPWRAVLVHGADPARLATLGLIVAPDDPRLRVAACPGQPGCAAASVPTRALAAALRPPPGTTVHVSGCAKSCAQRGPATITLVGRDGAFDLVRNGRAGDTPSRTGLSPAEAALS